MRTVKITVRKPEPPETGHLVTLELADPHETCSCLIPAAHLEESRPLDIDNKPLDEQGIRKLMLRETPLPEPVELQRIGDYLGGLLLYGEVAYKWDELRGRYPREDPSNATEGRSVLFQVDSPDLQALPWELARRNKQHLFVKPDNPFARISSEFEPNPRPEPDWWPLRVAVIVGAATNDEGVKVAEELEHVFDSLAKLGPDVAIDLIERPPDLTTLHEELKELRPHVLHFIGHGLSNGEGDGRLVIMAAEERWEWTADHIALLPWTPRIAVLNACRSKDAGQNPQLGTWHVADAFASLGTAAVLAMQGDIQGEAAAAFSAGFYEVLASSEHIDVCVANGRLSAVTALPDQRDFALPTLTLSRPPNRVLPRRIGEPPPDVNAIDTLLLCNSFVDRQTIRRDLLDKLDTERTRLVAVDGEGKVGKSELVRWALRQLARRGRQVMYVDLTMPEQELRRSAIGVLSEIRDVVEKVSKPSGKSPFQSWTENVARLTSEPSIEPAKRLDIDPEKLFKQFVSVLWKLPGAPLVLALDHLDHVDGKEFEDVRELLIKPLTLDAQGRVSLVLAGVGVLEEMKGLNPGYKVELRCFEPDQMSLLAPQYFRSSGHWATWPPTRRTLIASVLAGWGTPWTPAELPGLVELAEKLQ